MRAFVFPGQGSQFVGMARDLCENSGRVRELLERLEAAAGCSLLSPMFEGPEDLLRRTEIAQPAILAHSLAVLELVRDRGFQPSAVAGHSLGEYTALVAAGVLTAADAIRVVRRRGELMARAGQASPGAMAAVIGVSAEQLSDLIARASSGTVTIANYNCPGQLVISGAVDAVREVSNLAKGAGAKAVIPLRVSGAFHSPLMQPIADEFAAYLDRVDLQEAQVPVYCNVDASPHTDPEELRDCLKRQLTGSVMWEATVRRMVGSGVKEFYELGPGNVLTKLIMRTEPEVKTRAVSTWSDIEALEASPPS